MPALAAALPVAPVVRHPDTESFWKHTLNNIAVPAGVLSQAMGYHHTRPFRFRLVLSIKDFDTIRASKFACGFM
jgi:hypothetical protein